MWKNYLLLTLRNIWRSPLHTFINIIGLAVGIAACLTIYQLTTYELSFDTFHSNKDEIYRIYSEFRGKFGDTNRGVPTALAYEVKKGVSGVEEVLYFITPGIPNVTVKEDEGEKVFTDLETAALVPPGYFHFFSGYEWIAGSPASSLAQPYQVVLTAERARYYFQIEDPSQAMGRTLQYRDSLQVTVTGIVQKPSKPTDLFFTDFISFSTIEASSWAKFYPLQNWNTTNGYSQLFIRKQPNVLPSSIEAQLDSILHTHETPFSSPLWKVAYRLQPLANIHFNMQVGIFAHSRSPAHLPTLYILMLIAFILLVIAGINYTNLATAQAFRRSKEVGIRKVLGGTQKSLIRQFLGESFFVSLIAVGLAFVLTELSFGYFQEFMPEGISFNPISSQNLIFLWLAPLVVSLLAGFYPAFVLSSFQPQRALKNQFFSTFSPHGSQRLRKALIVIQFTVSVALIIGTFHIAQQVSYMLNKEMGFQEEAIAMFTVPYNPSNEKRNVLKNELSKLPGVGLISVHDRPPASMGYSINSYSITQREDVKDANFYMLRIDEHYLDLFGIKLLAGRKLFSSDTVREFLANETFVREFGYEHPEEVLGLSMNDGEDGHFPIVGVVKDFHHLPLNQKIHPMLLEREMGGNHLAVKLNRQGDDAGFQPLLKQMEATYKEVYPNDPFEYKFMDESIENFYHKEKRISRLTSAATAIAIFLSCMGLLGLISLVVVHRTKEIGIRKVLGATVAQIVRLLSFDFLRLVVIAFLIASPIAWYLIHQWLKDFAYRQPIQWEIFMAAGLLVIVVAFSTISIQSIRAALANPVDALRNE